MTTRARVRRGAFEQKVMAALPSWIVVEYAAQYLLAFGKTTSGSRQIRTFDSSATRVFQTRVPGDCGADLGNR